MLEYKIRFAGLAVAVVLSALSRVSADTWRLEKGLDWKAVSAEGNDKFLLAVAETKKLVNTGQSKAARKAFGTLKKDFPEIAGPDLDIFIEAEMLYCTGKFSKATRSYDKLLTEYPESGFRDAAFDRQFAIATAFLAGQKKTVLGIFRLKGYAEGEKIMTGISDRARFDAPIQIKAAVAVAKSYEKRGQFIEAYRRWSMISSRWPRDQISKEALLRMAQCMHSAYKGPKYDASSLISARSYYRQFRLVYPEDAEEIGVDEILKEIDEQLAYKQLSIGQYYQKVGNRQSANLYYDMVISDWPGSKAAQMAEQMLAENADSQETKK